MCVFVCARAHLRQSRLFMADFMFADGRQLLQRVAVVGERPRQPRKLGPSCRNDTLNTDYITFVTTVCWHFMTHTNKTGPQSALSHQC